jgi:DNA helicase II / ATP-dependent DNA helicase PcrA
VSKADNSAHTCYLAKLAAKIHQVTGGQSVRRLESIYKAIFIDEVQDLVGWDFEVMQAIAESGLNTFECVGDFRQTMYTTSVVSKKPQKDSDRLACFREMGFVVEYLNISFRCIQAICNLADRLHANDGSYMPTVSQTSIIPAEFVDHHGVFAVPAARIKEYLALYKPVILRWNRSSKKSLCEGHTAYNFGEAKGLGFDRVLVLPTDKHAKFLSGDSSAFIDDDLDQARNKLYVGITRGRYSVAFWCEGGSVINGAQVWNPVD